MEKALKQIAPLKSPRPDWFRAFFYQEYWNIVGDKVCADALHFLNGGELDQLSNFTYVALIPKVKNPVLVGEFRLINLCNVF